ncbi:unnamed protein product [Moneuplotes crassus]|uniref:RRM domain-containing protein n=2 Tax=Euplotes crassus TaxID=5936 RepID=A0AAD1UFV2_EUPCR|nr:unnamed protein product [Moneuplotes crassus]
MSDDYEAEEWYILNDKKENKGPFSLRDIDALYKTKSIVSNSLVWKDGMEEWKALYEVDTLKALLNDAVEEADNIPAITEQNEQQEPPKEPQEETKEEPQEENAQEIDAEELEKLANKALDNIEGRDLLDKNDEDLTEEQKQLKYKLLRKEKKKRYRKNKSKKKWYKAKINSNIYIGGLPQDITAEEIENHFSKCGAIRIDPNTGLHKIKLYKNDDGTNKGDALLSFENLESVDTAIEMLHQSNIRHDAVITVERAHFEQKGEEYRERKRQKIDEVEKKRIQAEKERRFAWNEEQASSIGLKIVILKHMFDPNEAPKDDEAKSNEFFQVIEQDVAQEVQNQCGKIEKIELFRDNPEGVIKIKFENPLSAEQCVDKFNQRVFDGQEIEVIFWDGKTNYKKVSETTQEVDKRVDEFGDWLDDQALPEELKIKKQSSGPEEVIETSEKVVEAPEESTTKPAEGE